MKSNCHRAFGAAAAFFLGFGASAALADGYYVGSVKDAAPVPAPVAYEWTGLSVGVGLGVGHFDQDVYGDAWRKDEVKRKECTNWEKVKEWKRVWDKKKGKYKKVKKSVDKCTKTGWVPKPSKDSSLSSASNDDDWNFFGTVQIGYDHLLGDRFLVGAFADFDFYRDADATFSDIDGGNWLSGKVERDHMWTVGGRLGYLVTPRILVYGLAGYSQMKLDGSLIAHFDDPWGKGKDSHINMSVKDRVDGWVLGGGLEAKLEKRLSLKLEYRYSQFDGISTSTSANHGWDGFEKDGKDYKRKYSDGGSLDLGDTDVHAVRAVLSFKLGRDEEPVAPLK